MQLGETESYLCVASEFCTMNTYYFYNWGGEGSTVRLKEGLCRLRGGRKCVRGRRVPGMPSGVCVHRPSVQRGETRLQVYPRHLCRGPLEGMSCRHSVCYAGAKCWPSLAEEGFLGWGALGGHPLPCPCSQPCCGSILGSGELASPPRRSETP